MNGNAVSDPAVFAVFLNSYLWCCPSWRYLSQKKVAANSTFQTFIFSPGLVHLTEGHPVICFGGICLFALFLERGIR